MVERGFIHSAHKLPANRGCIFEVDNTNWRVSPLYFNLSDVNMKTLCNISLEDRIINALFYEISEHARAMDKQVESLHRKITTWKP